jgi:hypothetical protein
VVRFSSGDQATINFDREAEGPNFQSQAREDNLSPATR